MTAASIVNVYILNGGINNWLDIFDHPGHEACPPDGKGFRHRFQAAVGDRYPSADPGKVDLAFTPRVKLQDTKSRRAGGCQ
jgi:hypothetical protein